MSLGKIQSSSSSIRAVECLLLVGGLVLGMTPALLLADEVLSIDSGKIKVRSMGPPCAVTRGFPLPRLPLGIVAGSRRSH